ncbi:Hypothetical predicted protein [Olea europaea subsp. europaea]|uniref:Uncharacterized protein n=1 Tax=Olea europaea subsp. europaea TaxID=158383 RepID=A0A8S0VL56_OLEEU|nr:Hypothetical predicted protein [Olea europaea subsp. europaea]
MAPHGEAIVRNSSNTLHSCKPSKNNNLQRTISDISFELSKEAADLENLPPISEIEDAKCECCGMSEECTPEYVGQVRDKFFGKWICGLCAEAVKEETDKNGGNREEALNSHIHACVRFNKFGRAYPILYQAEAMKEILKKRQVRCKSMGARDNTDATKKGGILRSSSCIPAITRDMDDLTMEN